MTGMRLKWDKYSYWHCLCILLGSINIIIVTGPTVRTRVNQSLCEVFLCKKGEKCGKLQAESKTMGNLQLMANKEIQMTQIKAINVHAINTETGQNSWQTLE